MNRLHENDIMDYLDGKLDEARLAAVEAHLRSHDEDAELVADIKMAMAAVREMDDAEPVRVSENFWPKLRDQLPASPPRHPVRAWLSALGAWLWPQPWAGRAARVGAVALVLAMAASWFGPPRATPQLSADEEQFIHLSVRRHNAYVSSQPLGGSLPVAVGEGHSGDREGDDEDSTERIP